MDVAFYTLGCKLNYAESSKLQEQFTSAGHEVVAFGGAADAIIINTCTVTDNADRECRQVIRRALRAAPDAFVGVTGCYAQLQPERIASIEGVDAVFGAREKFGILDLVQQFHKSDTPRIYVDELTEELSFTTAQSADADSRTRAFLKIQDGCNYKCSFCTIPLARGHSRSMAFDEILPALGRLESAGYHEVVLTGINLGDYRAATGEAFVDVLRAIADSAPRARLRISSIEPNLLSPAILDLVADSSAFVPHFHIPLQSGSSTLLRRMRRRYTADYYRDLILSIKDKMPDCAIGADVIVGFPGESDGLFEENYEFLQALPLSYLHVFTYSERENTPAAAYEGQVPRQRRKLRTARLRALSSAKKQSFYRSQCGTRRTVIPESRDSASGDRLGWTDNYVRCRFTAPASLLQVPTAIELREMEGEIVRAEMLARPGVDASQSADNRPSFIPLLS